MTEAADNNKGLPPYKGYEYQIVATVWVALKLMLDGHSDAVVVEPASGEDIAAQLGVEAEDASGMVLAGEIQIQVKYRQSSLWGLDDLHGLLKPRQKQGSRGPAPRERALEYLRANGTGRYLLLTNSQQDASLSLFSVSGIGDDSSALRVPRAQSDEPSLTRRIGVMAEMSPQRLALETREYLLGQCHVPWDCLDQCTDSLRDSVRQRLLGSQPRRWSWSDLQAVIEANRGRFGRPVPPVHPKNYGAMEGRLRERHALLLVGPPGTGKTTLAKALAAELELSDSPHRRFDAGNAGDIPEIRRLLASTGDHVFYLEDPWGAYEVLPGSDAWTSQLPGLVARAGPGKKFIVTSRAGVFTQAVGGRSNHFAPFRIDLGGNDYDENARMAIYERETASLSAEGRKVARQYREEVLAILETPQAIHTFCREIGTARQVSKQEAEAKARQCNTAELGQWVTRELEARGPDWVRAAVALWVVQLVNRHITTESVRDVRAALRAGGDTAPPDLQQTLGYLLQAGWASPRADGCSPHPTVLQAIAGFETRAPARFEDTVTFVFQGWSAAGSFSNILAILKAAPSTCCLVASGVQSALDDYLVASAVSAPDQRFEATFRDLACYSRGGDPVAVLARALVVGDTTAEQRDASRRLRPRRWKPPVLDAAEVTAIALSEEAEQATKRFIETDASAFHSHWGMGHGRAPGPFVAFVSQFGWDLPGTFASAFGRSALLSDYSLPFLAECLCILAPDRLDSVLSTCLERKREQEGSCSDYDDTPLRRSNQGELDAAEADRFDNEPPDDWFSARDAIGVAVRMKRRSQGFEWIPRHTASAELVEAWADCTRTGTTIEELNALVGCCERHGVVHLAFSALEYAPHPGLLQWLVQHFFTSSEDQAFHLTPALERFDQGEVVFEFLAKEAIKYPLPHRARVTFGILKSKLKLHGLHVTMPRPEAPEHAALPAFWEKVIVCLVDADARRLVEACYAKSPSPEPLPPQTVTDQDIPILRDFCVHWPPLPGVCAASVLHDLRAADGVLLARFLQSGEPGVHPAALALCDDRDHLIVEGLTAPDCFCRRAALRNLARTATPAEWGKLTALSEDPSSHVRRELAACIGRARYAGGVPALLRLLRDKRDYAGGMDAWRHQYEVAREACRSLHQLEPLPDMQQTAVREFLKSCEKSSLDTTVHGLLFRLLADHPSRGNVDFCIDYFDRTWLASKWNENDGYDLVQACLFALVRYLSQEAKWAEHVTPGMVVEVAGMDEEGMWLAAPALCLLGLCGSLAKEAIRGLAGKNTFSEGRAILLLALSNDLRTQKPLEVMQLVAASHPCFDVFGLADTGSTTREAWDAFLAAHPKVGQWLDGCQGDDALSRCTRWALSRLLGTPGCTKVAGDPPEPYTFKDAEPGGTR